MKQDIPRFVQDEAYTRNFGEQWNRYREVQLDSKNGTTITRDRFFSCTKWTAEELRGKQVLEAGCGAGRFTEILLGLGAEVFAFDYSSAVDACLKNNGPHPRLHVVQADIFRIPFPERSFDYVFCYGVLQHTPNPRGAFLHLVRYMKPGGKISVDCYRRTFRLSRGFRPNRWSSKYLYRWLTARLPVGILRRIVEWYVPRWLPVDDFCGRIPVLRSVVPLLVPCWNYRGILPLSAEQRKAWAVLDTFDALSARYDKPQRTEDIRSWFQEAGLADIDIFKGGNGIVGNGRRGGNKG